jgi:rod shape-determining protein MreC
LRARLADAEGENKRLVRYRRENEELRQLLNMRKPSGGSGVAADVVSLASTDLARRITLNVGARQGVRPKDVVYTARGVVGQVIQVSPLTSKVLLLTDRQSGVGAMTARTTARGVVKGTGKSDCKMMYLDFQADVREGDLVVTSGESEIFPKGLIIGRVLRVEKDKTYSNMTAYIDPAVPFDQISAVYVRVQTGQGGS